MTDEVHEDSSLAAHLPIACHVPTAEDLRADLAHRHSDAVRSSAPTQVCLHCYLLLLVMLCFVPSRLPCFVVYAMLCCTMSFEEQSARLGQGGAVLAVDKCGWLYRTVDLLRWFNPRAD